MWDRRVRRARAYISDACSFGLQVSISIIVDYKAPIKEARAMLLTVASCGLTGGNKITFISSIC